MPVVCAQPWHVYGMANSYCAYAYAMPMSLPFSLPEKYYSGGGWEVGVVVVVGVGVGGTGKTPTQAPVSLTCLPVTDILFFPSIVCALLPSSMPQLCSNTPIFGM